MERRLVDDLGARHVDEDGGRLHQRELARAEQATRSVGQRERDGHVVGAAQHLVEGVRPAEKREVLVC